MRNLVRAVLVIVLCSPAAIGLTPPRASALPGDVPTYLGDTTRSGFNPVESVLNVSNAASLSQLWSASSHAAPSGSGGAYIDSQPVVAGGAVYWGDLAGYEHASDISTGQELWSTYLGSFVPDPAFSCFPSYMGVIGAATMGVAGGRTLLFVPGGGAYSDPQKGTHTYFFALDPSTGAIVWDTPLGDGPDQVMWSSPALYNGSLYEGLASNGDCGSHLTQGKLFRLDAGSGAVQGVFKVVSDQCSVDQPAGRFNGGGGVWGSPTIDPADGSVFIATGNTSPTGCQGAQAPYTQAVVKLRAADLSVLDSWQQPDDAATDHDFGSTPTLFTAVVGGTPTELVGVGNKNGTFYAFNRSSLHQGPVWKTSIADAGNASPENGDGTVSPAAWDGAHLYVAGGKQASCSNSAGTLRALDPATGHAAWTSCLDGAVLGGVSATPTLLAIGAGPNMELFDHSGNKLFSYTDPSTNWFWATPTLSGGNLYAANSSGTLYAFNVGAKPVLRVAGDDRVATSINISHATFSAQSAGAVVLARSDTFPDALGGGPLAAAVGGPLLLTPPDGLDSRVQAEIQRILAGGKTVYLLGGTSALSGSIDGTLRGLGYSVTRYAGSDRYDTSAQIAAQGLGAPSTVLFTTGDNFPDALSAGPAAASIRAALLLTAGTVVPTSIAAYLSAHPPSSTYAIGGPAATAEPSATPLAGKDRYATAAMVASHFFPNPTTAGIASGEGFPDALSGGANEAFLKAPLLLTQAGTMPQPTSAFLSSSSSSLTKVTMFGGPAVIADVVRSGVLATIG